MSSPLNASSLADHGLKVVEGGGVAGTLVFERPTFLFGHRVKDCTVGAFTYLNANGKSSAYRTHFGRYAQAGESVIIGPPEHPTDGFSSHPFAFTRPQYMPAMYELPDFARLAPEAQPGPSYVDTVPSETWIGHEAYLGAGCFVKRGVRIGMGAVIGAASVVTRDVPDYAIAIGNPARVVRMRFDDRTIERMLALAWWMYDLAPFKQQVDYTKVEATLAFYEQHKSEGQLQLLSPDTYTLTRSGDGLTLERCAHPLF